MLESLVLLEAAEQVIPEQEKIFFKWITPETLRLVRERRGLKIGRDRSDTAEGLYRESATRYGKRRKQTKAKWLEDQCDDIEKITENAKQEGCTR